VMLSSMPNRLNTLVVSVSSLAHILDEEFDK
jgi:hypothetical protein